MQEEGTIKELENNALIKLISDVNIFDEILAEVSLEEILGKKENFIKKRPLAESVEAFFVFNDKKLNLKKYKYLHHKDFEFSDKECAYLSHN